MKFTKKSFKTTLPDFSSNLQFNQLIGEVKILRDKYGIPHIQAENVNDAFFGQGFATAQDRLWHMDYDRMRAYGRCAEYIGEDGLKNDLFIRPLQIQSSVIDDYSKLDKATIQMLDSYASGVNSFLESTDNLPIEYTLINIRPQKWEPWDCLAVYKIRHVMMGGFEPKLWRSKVVNELGTQKASKLFKSYQPDHLMIIPPGELYSGPYANGEKIFEEIINHISGLTEPDSGSNSWVLDGTKTKTGRPMIAGDPHRELDVPNVYYQNHISCDEFDVIGLSFPGCPGFPHFGHNSNVAWCVTHAMSDYQDLYIEKFNPQNLEEYQYKGKWIKANVINDTIKVKNSNDRSIKLISTMHGPIISGEIIKEKAIALKYTALEPNNKTASSIRSMLSVQNAKEMDDSMKDWVDPCNNFVFADTQGAIRYLNRGKIPIRPKENVWLPVPGWTDEGEWNGFIKHKDLPRIINPDQGFIITANQKIVDEKYPHLLSLDYVPGYRAQVIYDLIKDTKNASLKDMIRIHSACQSIPAKIFCKLLMNLNFQNKKLEQLKNKLISWDGSMNINLIEPTIYSAMRISLNQKLAKHNLGPLAKDALDAAGRGIPGHMRQLEALFVSHAKANNTEMLPKDIEWDSLIKESMKDGIEWLINSIGKDINLWKWGNVHKTIPKHTLSPIFPNLSDSLNPPSISINGDGDTPHAGFFAPSEPFNIIATSVARYYFDLSDWNKCQWIVPLGSSGHPGSEHYFNQMKIWSKTNLIPMLYDWKKIQTNSVSSQILIPDN